MASARAKTVKLADLIDNCVDICRNDPKFGPVYLQEMVDLLDVLHEGNQRLYRKALRTVENAAKALRIAVPASDAKPGSPPARNCPPMKSIEASTVYASSQRLSRQGISWSRYSRLTGAHLHRVTILKSRAGNGQRCRHKGRWQGTGYILHEELLSAAPLTARQILCQQTVEIDVPLAEVIHILTMFSCCFVTVGGAVCGVISRRILRNRWCECGSSASLS